MDINPEYQILILLTTIKTNHQNYVTNLKKKQNLKNVKKILPFFFC